MSRIGRLAVKILPGVTVKCENQLVTVTGKLGTLTQTIDSKSIVVKIENNEVHVSRTEETKAIKAMHGLYRTLINNMVVGVSSGFTKTLIINGVGYKAVMQGKKLVMNLGLSHQVEIEPDADITITCKTPTEVVVSGYSKEKVGHVAAVIKAKRPIEPYHGYGIRYNTEAVVIKEGKTAGK